LLLKQLCYNNCATTGAAWPINLYPEILGHPGEKTNEFDHHAGDDANPQCLKEQQICGTTSDGVQATCCGELTCSCKAASADDNKCVCENFEKAWFNKIALQAE